MPLQQEGTADAIDADIVHVARHALGVLRAFTDVVLMRWRAGAGAGAGGRVPAGLEDHEGGGGSPTAPTACTARVTQEDVAAVSYQSALPLIKFSPSRLLEYLGQGPQGTQALGVQRNQALGEMWQDMAPASFVAARLAWQARGQKPRRMTSKELMAEAAAAAAAAATAAATAGMPAPVPGSDDEDPYADVQTPADVAAFQASHTQGETLKLMRTKGITEESKTIDMLHGMGGVSDCGAALWWAPGAKGVGIFTASPAPGCPLTGPVVDPGPFAVVGRIDCAMNTTDGHKVPVEIKTRMHGLAPADTPLPLRDRLQLQAYIQAMDAPWGLHVERAMGSDQFRSTVVHRDDALWTDRVLAGLRAFACDLRRVMRGGLADEDLRHSVLASLASTDAVAGSNPKHRAALKRAAPDVPRVHDEPAPAVTDDRGGVTTRHEKLAATAASALIALGTTTAAPAAQASAPVTTSEEEWQPVSPAPAPRTRLQSRPPTPHAWTTSASSSSSSSSSYAESEDHAESDASVATPRSRARARNKPVMSPIVMPRQVSRSRSRPRRRLDPVIADMLARIAHKGRAPWAHSDTVVRSRRLTRRMRLRPGPGVPL